ncbi:MAG: hypothetical protein IJA72_04300 [Clostridia bacterium]|nr:hypothetical protein [Clostridia bacterium]
MIGNNTDSFDIIQIDEIEVFNRLKPELAKAFGEYLHSKVDETDVNLVTRGAWSKREEDGQVYRVRHLCVALHKSLRLFRRNFFVLELTPYSCYFCDDEVHIKSTYEPDKYQYEKNKDLTKAYRRTMQNLYGEEWRNAFDAYIQRVKERRQNLLNKSYNDSMKEIEDDINEEVKF